MNETTKALHAQTTLSSLEHHLTMLFNRRRVSRLFAPADLLPCLAADGSSLFSASLMVGNPSLALSLLQLGADPTLHETEVVPLIEACRLLHPPLLARLLESPEISLDAAENAPVLFQALLVPKGSLEDARVVEEMALLLVEEGACLTWKGEVEIRGVLETLAPLELAVERGYPRVATRMLSSAPDLLSQCFQEGPHLTLLHRVVENDEVELLKLLLGNRSPLMDRMIETTNLQGKTVLHVAAQSQRSLSLHYLLEDGRVRALINQQDAANQTALHYAALNRNAELYSYLEAQGADPHLHNGEETAFSLAISVGIIS